MRLPLTDLGRSPKRFDLSSRPDFRAAVGEALEGEVTSLDGSVAVSGDDDRVSAVVRGHAEAARPCDLCGGPATVAVDVDATLTYGPPLTGAAGEVELDEDDLDVGFHDGSGLDLLDPVREAFALAAPNRVTCAPDGCPEAARLRASAQEQMAEASPFAALKDLL